MGRFSGSQHDVVTCCLCRGQVFPRDMSLTPFLNPSFMITSKASGRSRRSCQVSTSLLLHNIAQLLPHQPCRMMNKPALWMHNLYHISPAEWWISLHYGWNGCCEPQPHMAVVKLSPTSRYRCKSTIDCCHKIFQNRQVVPRSETAQPIDLVPT